MRITSPDNPLVRRLRRLAESARACRDAGRTLAEGVHVIEAALDAGVAIVTLVLRGGVSPAVEALVARLEAADSHGRVKRVVLAPALYDALSPVEHGAGVLAEIEIPPAPDWTALSVDAVYLDGVQDPGNVGTLLRTAAAAGVRRVIVGPGTAYAWSPKVMRAAMGAHFVLHIAEGVAAADAARGFEGTVLAADVGGEDLYAAEWGRAPTLWLFGSEGQGLSPDAAAVAQRRLRIPLATGVESLNVAAAAAVCLFEQARRRRAGRSGAP
ncbi:MAG: RNA methyltransferase [Burkholderiaceae bacterium]|nr:RNA methyltransferase [Burkholderiaceae bacterium]